MELTRALAIRAVGLALPVDRSARTRHRHVRLTRRRYVSRTVCYALFETRYTLRFSAHTCVQTTLVTYRSCATPHRTARTLDPLVDALIHMHVRRYCTPRGCDSRFDKQDYDEEEVDGRVPWRCIASRRSGIEEPPWTRRSRFPSSRFDPSTQPLLHATPLSTRRSFSRMIYLRDYS